MDINEAKDFLENRINPNMVGTVLRAAEEEGEKHALPSGGEVGDVITKTEDGVEWKAPYKPCDYSTEEQDTGLKWIDGKPIYQKTWVGTFTTGSTAQFVTVDATFTKELAKWDKIIKVDGQVVCDDSYNNINGSRTDGTNKVCLTHFAPIEGFLLRVYYQNKTVDYLATVYYTKTT